jgi:uncharacterized protein (DUF2336 family)
MEADEAARVRLGASAGTPAETLCLLARDPSVTVRASLALNTGVPPAVNAMLANDADERVRMLLVRKLAALTPGLSKAARTDLGEQTHAALLALAADAAVRVRAALADAVKHMPDAPKAVVLRLARDHAVMVCEPVIQFSPMLTVADLVGLVTAARSPVTARAAAARHGIGQDVSDSVAASADSEAIRALLSNPSAQIREATLDALAEQAASYREWHEPLVRRPVLSPRAARALASIVATHLVEALAARPDFDPLLTEELRCRLEARLSGAALNEDPAEIALATAMALATQRALTEEVILAAARRGEVPLVEALLAVSADVPVAMVKRAAALRSAKGVLSLVWKAGFSMQVASVLQPLLARVAPGTALVAEAGGGFPLAVDEMQWQIELLARPGR